MANVKISQLTSASSLTGSEVLPVVQGGTTKKVTTQAIADLASGGGGGQTFDVTADGVLGADISVSYVQRSFVPKTSTGTISAEVGNYASFNYFATGGGGYGGGYGGSAINTTATTVSFNSRFIGDISLSGGNTVQHFVFPEAVDQNSSMSGFMFSGNALVSFSCPLLQSCRGIQITNNSPALTTLNFPLLKTFNSYGQISINGTCAVTEFSATNFPLLEEFNVSINEPGFLQVINLPSVKTWKGSYHASSGGNTGNSVLNTLAFPAMVNYESASLNYNSHAQLANVTIGTIGTLKTCGLSWGGVSFYFDNCALTQASVDGILTTLASLDGTNGTDLSSNGYVSMTGGTSAAPSSTGLAAKDTLLARGFYIGHN